MAGDGPARPAKSTSTAGIATRRRWEKLVPGDLEVRLMPTSTSSIDTNDADFAPGGRQIQGQRRRGKRNSAQSIRGHADRQSCFLKLAELRPKRAGLLG